MKNLKKLVELLIDKNLKISLAESCTGGLIAKTITDIPGSSLFFQYGIVSYSNESKINILKVNTETLNKYGAVSEQTALEMAEGVQKILNTDIAVSVTGIAGPGGGSESKPVGTVYVGIKIFDSIAVKYFLFKGNRNKIRNLTTEKVIELLYNYLTGI